MALVHTLIDCRDTQIELIEIKQRGKFNEESKYWPIKAHVKGSCQISFLQNSQSKSFDKVGDFLLYQDDYENWKASMDKPLGEIFRDIMK
jgi:hypothetical protein